MTRLITSLLLGATLAAGLLTPQVEAAVPGQAERLEALEGKEAEARVRALHWLAENGDHDATPGVLAALQAREGAERQLAEAALWAIWSRSGDPAVDRLLQRGSRLLALNAPAQAVGVFSQVIKLEPAFAEGYNKRATAYYQLGAYRQSLADIARTLSRNPDHFGALSGAGLCWLALDEPEAALRYFERALAVHPGLEGIQRLRDAVASRLRQPV